MICVVGLLLRWIINALSLLLTAHVIQGIEVQGFFAALIAVLVLGIANAIIRPILIFLTLPLNIMTLGLFTFVINGFILYMVGAVVEGIEISGFLAALAGTILLSVISSLANKLIR